ncbi:MAG TPA: transglycosylase domain-containing protein [Rectinemataceae bacterium]
MTLKAKTGRKARSNSERGAAGSPAQKLARGLKRLLGCILKLALWFHAVFIVLTCLLIFLYKFVNPAYTLLMPYRSVGYGWKLQKPIPLPLAKVPIYVRNMLVAVEDGKFWVHKGVDLEAFKRAREINARVGKPLYGGSTLTMQVARTLFLVPEKSYIRKYLEVIIALELEAILSKQRILELYFGYAEWGKGIFGIEAAARSYYKASIASLDKDQAARLIALLSSPIKYTPSTLHKSAILRERYSYLTRRFVAPSVAPEGDFVESAPPPAPEPGAEADEGGAAAQEELQALGVSDGEDSAIESSAADGQPDPREAKRDSVPAKADPSASATPSSQLAVPVAPTQPAAP